MQGALPTSFDDGKLPLRIYGELVKFGQAQAPLESEVILIKKQHNFRIEESDFEEIKTNAKKAKLNISDFIIAAAKGQQIIILEDLHSVCHELRKIGGNLNQLAMLANQGRITCVNLTQMYEAVDRLWQPLNLLTEKTRRIKR